MVDFPPCDDVCGALEEHVRRFFGPRSVEAFTWNAGPLPEANPHFRALRIEPEQGEPWTYVSTGGWAANEGDDRGLELVVCTPGPDARAVELLAMAIYYHHNHQLGLGHTMPIGEAWLPGSACDHLLVSLPYPFGLELQTCHVGDRHVDFLWLLPITAAECAFKVSKGLEALESRFDEAAVPYWDVERTSVV